MNTDAASEQPSTAAQKLVGTTIPGGWVVTRMTPRAGTEGATSLTGSFFSIGYIVSNGKTEAFLKVIDVPRVLQVSVGVGGSLIQRMKLVADSHTFECDILAVCQKARLDRIIRILDQGELPPPPGETYSIPYILFELADGDVRKIVSRSNKIDDAWRFKVLHDVAVGIQQLHSQKISHQDLKPSNVLLFEKTNEGAKIGDLGRASRIGMDASHDGNEIPGDVTYAPPEQVYGVIPENWGDRRESCDLYHLGSLATFMFTGSKPTDYYVRALPPQIKPHRWAGAGVCNYQMALPFLIAAFTNYIDAIRRDLPDWAADELSQIITHACHPDYSVRGDPGARQRAGRPIGVETFVSRFDRLAKWAEIELRR